MEQWMIVYVTDNLNEAHIVAGRLEYEGIKAVVDYMAGRSAIGITLGRWGEVRVLVHPSDYDIAEAILSDEPEMLEPGDDTIIYDEGWDDDTD